MDYSLVAERPGGTADGLLVEEFVRGDDHSAVGLRGLVWTRADPRWVDSPSFSRRLRSEPAVLARVTPVDRGRAADVYRTLGGGDLPDEPALRGHFAGLERFAVAPPLRLGPDAGLNTVPAGFRERRVYRVLFAKELKTPLGDGERTVGGDHFAWTVRPVGRGIAWALDVTVLLVSEGAAIGPVLDGLTDWVRRHGLIPVTTERFA